MLVYGVVKNERLGGIMGDLIDVGPVPPTMHGEWFNFSAGFAAVRGYDFMAPPSFWRRLETGSRSHTVTRRGDGLLGVALVM